MKNILTDNRIEKLRKNIDFSDIPEIESMEGFRLRNYKPIKKTISMRIDLIKRKKQKLKID